MTTRTVTRVVTPGTAAGELMGPADDRRVVVIAGVQNGRVTLSADRSVSDGAGIVVAQGDIPFSMNETDFG